MPTTDRILLYLIFCSFLLTIGYVYAETGKIPVTKEDIQSQSSMVSDHDLQELERDVQAIRTKIDNTNEAAYARACDAIDRLIGYVTLVVAIFGITITLAGIFIAYQSIRARHRSEEAIRTLENAKSYVTDKVEEFDKTVESKLTEIDKLVGKFAQISLDQLGQDVEEVTKKIKERGEKGITTEAEAKVKLLERRIAFFEEIGMPDDPKLLYSKAKVCAQKGLVPEALELLKRAVGIDPKRSTYFGFMADLYVRLGQDKEALDSIKKAIELDPRDLGYQWTAGRLLNKMDKFDEAMTFYERAERIEKDKLKKPDADEGDWLNYYECLIILSKYDDAEKVSSNVASTIRRQKYRYVFDYLSGCLHVLRGEVDQAYKRVTDLVKAYVRKPLEESTTWNFGDINIVLTRKLSKNQLKVFISVQEMLEQKILPEECQIRITKLAKRN